MTYSEFMCAVRSIQTEPFICEDCHPIEYGMRRAAFEQRQLERLIILASKSEYLTVRRRLTAWQRKLSRAIALQDRFKSLGLSVNNSTAL